MLGSITDVKGIKVGHSTHQEALTGCTVILCEEGSVAGVDVRGGAPGTRETDLLRPLHLIQEVHAVVLSGGSAFGLEAAGGVVRYLEERDIGFDVGVTKVPIVPAAVLFDLYVGDPKIRPDSKMGYQACLNATSLEVKEGNVGAGTGATVGKALQMRGAMKGGIGTASVELAKGIIVGAIVAVNAFGDVINPKSGEIIAGTRNIEGEGFLNSADYIKRNISEEQGFSMTNTTLGVVATNAMLDREETNKVAQMAHNGLARAINPVHTMFDGDTIFALATWEKEGEINAIGTAAAEVIAEAIVRAVKTAESIAGFPAWKDIVSKQIEEK